MNIFKKINDKNFHTFDAFYESDEYFNIQNDENKRKIFYYYALKFSSEKNRNIQELYNDLKKILEKMENAELQKYDKECYINIINNYLEKIELFIAERNFFKKNENEKEKEKENYNNLRDIIKLMNNHFKQKKKCPMEIYENLDDLYNILLIKMKHKIPKEYQNRMNRHLDEFKKMLNDIQKFDGINIKQVKQEDEKNNNFNIIQKKEKENYNVNYNENNNISNNINNNYNKNNLGYNMINTNLLYANPGIYSGYPQINNVQNYGNKILNLNYNNNPYNNQMNYNQIKQNNQSLKKSINIFDNNEEEEGKWDFNNNDYNNRSNNSFLNNLINKKDNNNNNINNSDKFSFNINESYNPENENYANELIKNNGNIKNNINSKQNNRIINDFNEFGNPDNYNKKLEKSKQYTNERISINNSINKSKNKFKSDLNPNNPYRKDKEFNEININNNEIINSVKNKKIKKSVLERRKNYDKIKKTLNKLNEDDF